MHVTSAHKNPTDLTPLFSPHTTSNNKMYKSSNIFIFFFNLYICYAFLFYHKSHITQKKTHFSFQFTQHSSARIYATQLNKPAIPFSCGIGISQRAPDYSLGDHYSALQLTTMLDKPAQQHFSYGTGTNKRALNYRVGNRYPAADNTTPMLNVLSTTANAGFSSASGLFYSQQRSAPLEPRLHQLWTLELP